MIKGQQLDHLCRAISFTELINSLSQRVILPASTLTPQTMTNCPQLTFLTWYGHCRKRKTNLVVTLMFPLLFFKFQFVCFGTFMCTFYCWGVYFIVPYIWEFLFCSLWDFGSFSSWKESHREKSMKMQPDDFKLHKSARSTNPFFIYKVVVGSFL